METGRALPGTGKHANSCQFLTKFVTSCAPPPLQPAPGSALRVSLSMIYDSTLAFQLLFG
jgi:hypothetical protein